MDDNTYYTIMRVHRDDITSLLEQQGKLTKATKQQIQALKDGDMKVIAERMHDGLMYCFWEVLEEAVEGYIDKA